MRKFIFILIVCIMSIISIKNYSNRSVITDGTIYLVPSVINTWYSLNKDNTGYTTINGVSNIYNNMLEDGYSIYREVFSKDSIDISFVKERYPSYRLYYLYPSGFTYCFSSNYENSIYLFSYINER